MITKVTRSKIARSRRSLPKLGVGVGVSTRIAQSGDHPWTEMRPARRPIEERTGEIVHLIDEITPLMEENEPGFA